MPSVTSGAQLLDCSGHTLTVLSYGSICVTLLALFYLFFKTTPKPLVTASYDRHARATPLPSKIFGILNIPPRALPLALPPLTYGTSMCWCWCAVLCLPAMQRTTTYNQRSRLMMYTQHHAKHSHTRTVCLLRHHIAPDRKPFMIVSCCVSFLCSKLHF